MRGGGGGPLTGTDSSGIQQLLSAVLDGSAYRLQVEAKMASGFITEVNLDETADEVAVFGGVDGSETADAATRQILNVDGSGRVRIDGARRDVSTIRQAYTAAQTNALVVSVGSGSRIVVTGIMATTSAANTLSPSVRIGLGTASVPTGAGVVASHPGIPAGAGFVREASPGLLGIGADGEDLRLACSDPGGTLEVVVTYYTVTA